MNDPMPHSGPLIPLAVVETHALAYRTARDVLAEQVTELEAELQALKAKRMPKLRRALTQAADCEAALREAVQATPAALWASPRTRTFHGIKVGYAKQRGKVEFDDEAKVILRIRNLLPPDQAALLIRVREAVHKPAVYDLTAADLRRLGITVSADCDQLVIKDAASELDKALQAILDSLRIDEEETA
ncbi:MAG: hypothetical protein ACYCZD_12925 [Rhodanobacter sp.]